MRPSFHCATGSPCSAAYCSAVKAVDLAPTSGACAVARKLSLGDSDAVAGVVVPSKASADSGAKPPWPHSANTRPPAPTRLAIVPRAGMRALDIRIARLLSRRARMGDGAVAGRSHLLGVFPQIAGGVFACARLPFLPPPLKLILAQLDVERPLVAIELDDIAVADQRDRAADCRFRTDMADAEAARGAGETAVGDQRDLA